MMRRIRELDDVVQRQRHRDAARVLRLRDEIAERKAENKRLTKQIAVTRAEMMIMNERRMPKDQKVERGDAATRWHYETIRNERLVEKWQREIVQVQGAASQKNTPLARVIAECV